MIAPLPVKPADPPSFMATWTGRTVAQGLCRAAAVPWLNFQGVQDNKSLAVNGHSGSPPDRMSLSAAGARKSDHLSTNKAHVARGKLPDERTDLLGCPKASHWHHFLD